MKTWLEEERVGILSPIGAMNCGFFPLRPMAVGHLAKIHFHHIPSRFERC
jgi:hypothetical protein